MDRIRHTEVLINLINTENIKIIAEVGIWKCTLLEKIFNACEDIITQYWAIDPWRSMDPHKKKYQAVTKEHWDQGYFYACRLTLSFPQVRVLRLASLDAVKVFPEKYFDLVFIDANHKYEAVLSDIKAWLPLVKPGGFLTGHDYQFRYESVIKAVDECFKDKKKKIIKDAAVWIHKVK